LGTPGVGYDGHWANDAGEIIATIATATIAWSNVFIEPPALVMSVIYSRLPPKARRLVVVI